MLSKSQSLLIRLLRAPFSLCPLSDSYTCMCVGYTICYGRVILAPMVAIHFFTITGLRTTQGLSQTLTQPQDLENLTRY